MTQKTDLNITPYYDDYDSDKKFHKVLYRAGRPLQARELTQSQSILQDQIEKFGDHFFKEGSIVSGASSNVDMDIYFIKVKADNPTQAGDDSVESYRTDYHGKFLQGQTTGVVVKVITSVAATSDDPATLICKQYTSGTDDAGSFIVGGDEVLKEVTITENTGVITVNTSNNNHFKTVTSGDTPSGRASIAEIQDGVVFTRGFFVVVDKQTIVLEKYSGKPSYRVGLQINEELISSTNDTSLLDNAQGTNNENAPGADRLKINLELKKVALDVTTNVNFIELARVNNGIMELEINRPIYNEIEDTFARRTFDTNGDFIVRPFITNFREHLKTITNKGFYLEKQGGVEDKFIMQISPGKAYVKGYEIEKTGTTNLEFNKARTTVNLAGASTPVRLGNELLVNNIKALPEIADSTNTDSFKPIKLYDIKQNSGALDSSAKHIGFARVRHIENKTNVSTQASDEVQLFLFDVKMFTEITYSAHSGTAVVGDKLEGATSGATGIVAYDDNSDGIYLHDVVGTFQSGEAISSRGDGNFALTTSQNTGVRTYNVGQTRCVFQATPGSGSQNFIGDVVLDDLRELSGIITFASNSATVTGLGSQFAKELNIGDLILDSTGSEFRVRSIESNISMTIEQLSGANVSSVTAQTQVKVIRKRAKLKNQDQAAAIFSWPRDYVSTITPKDNAVTVRKQIKLTVSNGDVTIPCTTSEEKFATDSNDNFQFAVVTQSSSGSRTLNAGDVKYPDDISSFPSPSDSALVVPIGDQTADAFDDGAEVLASYTVIRKSPTIKNKELKSYRSFKIDVANSAGTAKYGYAYDHKELALAVPDVHKIHAVLEAVPGTTSGSQNNATPPNFVPTISSGSFATGEIVVGQTSGARGKIIDYNGDGVKLHFVYLDELSVFSSGESIVGQTSSGVATIASVSSGSPDIRKRYFLDNGQRDGMYDTAKLQLKPGATTPNNPITIIFDHFEPGTGDYFAVNSYTGNVDYDDIPDYSPNKVDLGGFEPDGQFELGDAVDFRSPVNDLQTPASGDYDQDSVTSLSGLSTSPFAYESRVFSDEEISCPVPGTTVDADISFYVPRIDKVFLHKSGRFQISGGQPAISPQRPDPIDGAIELFELYIPAYTENLKEINTNQKDHRRFTMKDIGKINQRLTNLERITALSLLEKDIQSKQILDADGFDLFKSGFLVDNFRGHKIGDVVHPDYKAGIDTENGVLRPMHFTNFFDISQNTAKSANYQKTGDLITLPYKQVDFVKQDKASRQINVNPYHVFAFIGDIKLTPETDLWNDTANLPEVRINREGNYDAVLAENENSLGTVWNAWQTTWVGQPEVVSSQVESAVTGGSWNGDPGQGGNFAPSQLQTITREVTQTPETQTRTGVKTSVVEEFVETRNDRVVSVTIVPFIRSREIKIDAQNLKPNTNHYVYFDGIRVDEYVTPESANFSNDSNADAYSTIRTNANGRFKGSFFLPNNSRQRFPTGQRELRITSSSNNLNNPASQGTAIYTASGTLQTNQTEITSTRNARVVRENLSGTRQTSRRGERLNVDITDLPPPEPPAPPPVVLPPPREIPIGPVTPPRLPPVVIIDPPLPPIPTPPPPPILTPPVVFDPVPIPDPVVVVEPIIAPTPSFPRPIDFDIDFGLRDLWAEPGMMNWSDPLAQSFLVDRKGGVFLSSIDLFFKTKDKSMPVSVQIRNMVNGYPGQIVVPFSTKTLEPEDVNISEDGSTSTTFTFESPVFLDTGNEYCFVVYSNSNEYECFISRMGEPDLVTGETISGQPYAGSLFTSQNASTWTAEQMDDLKFTMKQCEFEIEKVASVQFENDALPNIDLQTDPIETFVDQTYVKVFNYSHGHYSTTSNVTLSGVVGDKADGVLLINAGSVASGSISGGDQDYDDLATTTSGSGTGAKLKLSIASDNTIESIFITDPGVGYSTSDTLTITNPGSMTCTIEVGIDGVGDTLGGIPIAAINGTHTSIADFSIDSYNIELNTLLDGADYDLVSDYGATQSTLAGGQDVKASRDLYYDALHTMIPSVRHEGTDMFVSVRRTGANSPEYDSADSSTHLDTVYSLRTANDFIKLNDNVYFERPSLVASPINEQNEMGSTKSFECLVQLRSTNRNLSPVIDVGTIGALAIMNRINDIDESGDVSTGEVYVPSTEPDGDNNAFVYVTRKVSMKTPATQLKVLADNFRAPGTDLKFMFKILKNDEETPLDDLGFEYFNTDGSPDVETPRDARNFKEYEYTADGLPEFSAFVVKIVGQSTNTSVVPIVSALRCMALA